MGTHLDKPVFMSVWRFLCNRWNKKPDEREAMAYFWWLSARGMDTQTFKGTAEAMWACREFFPKPVDFLMAGAEAEWRVILEVLDGGDDNPNFKVLWTRVSRYGRAALESLGGTRALRISRDVPRFRQEFLRAYERSVSAETTAAPTAVAEAAALAPLSPGMKAAKSSGLQVAGRAAASSPAIPVRGFLPSPSDGRPAP